MSTKAKKPTAKRPAKKTPAKKPTAKKQVVAKRALAQRSAVKGPEAGGGPFARREAFLAERLAVASPKPPDTAEPQPAPEVPRSADTAARARAIESLPEGPEHRRRVVAEFRSRQRAQTDARPRQSRAARTPPDASSADTDTEDELFGPEPDAAPEAAVARAAPIPPPGNNWVPIGPSVLRRGQGGTLPSTSGRVNGIAVASGGNRVYVAAANGGVWRSDDAGASWRSLMDAWDLNPTTASSDSLSCGSIAIDPANPDRIFVGTGDGNEAIFFGVGPVVSTDGGANWNTEPVAAGSPALGGQSINAMAVDPGNGDRVVAGTFLGVYRREPNTAGGFQWARKTGPSGRISSVVVARTGSTTTFYAAPFNGPVYSSTDGATWATVGTGFPSTNIGRIGLAVRATDPTVVYALVAGIDNSMRGVWRLDTGAGQWRQVTGHPTVLFGTAGFLQGTYDLAIAVDPGDVNRIYLGGSTVVSAGQWSGAVYRSTVTSSGTGASLAYSMANTYIGGSVHADIHCIVFAPGDSAKLWVGCDGGAFYSTNPSGSGNAFVARNTGLQTLTMNRLHHHPTEDAVVFCGTQDNGGGRFTGEEAWLHSVWGDCGEFVVNWNDPYSVIATYVRESINRATDGGTRYNYTAVGPTLPAGDSAEFYAPLQGTPPSATAAEANRVAFGSQRVWISDTFGGGWTSIPAGSATDDLGSRIRSLRFASFTRLYAGTRGGRVYRFVQSGGTWTHTRLDTMGGANTLPLALPVTSIAIDASDATGNSIYITLGGMGDFRHVWRFNGTQWQARSGPSAGAATSLIDVQHNAIVCDPNNTATLYVGADIGVWRSTDSGATWAVYSDGLPDAAVLDLDLHNPRRLLRAATYGRGVFEFRLDVPTSQGIELYVRDTQLDQGRFTTINGLADPTAQGETVAHWRGPDIKLDTPDASGQYQFPITPGTTIDFEAFTNQLTDDFQNVATHATTTITTRVYVQVHNRGITPANDVRVMLLLANASAGLPNLPFGFATNVQNGTPINTADWKTVGFATLDDVRAGFPRIAAFQLTSNLLPPPTSLAGNDHHCVLALVHHASDTFTATQTVTDLLSLGERKAAHKNLKVVQFTGTLPSSPPVTMAFRISNASTRRKLLTTLLARFGKYPGQVRIFLPRLVFDGRIEDLIEGGKAGSADFDIFRKWAQAHIKQITTAMQSQRPWNKEWAEQRIADVHAATESGLMIKAARGKDVKLRNIVMPPKSRYTIFVMFSLPPNAKTGTFWPFEMLQLAAGKEQVIGGLSGRTEIVPPSRERRSPLRDERRGERGRIATIR
jgi:hypothetical protein